MSRSHSPSRSHRRSRAGLVGLPSGLAMTAGQLMTSDYPVLEIGSTLRDASGVMAAWGLPAVPVQGSGGVLLGSVTVRAILAAMAIDIDRSMAVRDVMDPHPAAVLDYAPVESVLAEMDEAGLWALPVVDHENRLVGVVSLSNLAGAVSPSLLNHAWGKFAAFHRD